MKDTILMKTSVKKKVNKILNSFFLLFQSFKNLNYTIPVMFIVLWPRIWYFQKAGTSYWVLLKLDTGTTATTCFFLLLFVSCISPLLFSSPLRNCWHGRGYADDIMILSTFMYARTQVINIIKMMGEKSYTFNTRCNGVYTYFLGNVSLILSADGMVISFFQDNGGVNKHPSLNFNDFFI